MCPPFQEHVRDEHRAGKGGAAITWEVMGVVLGPSYSEPMQTITATPDRRPGNTVGHLLREWRATRGMSQLDLAMHAGFSARHVSFIESGRTQPSRQALLVLAETLEVPLRERNRLLEAGGYAHIYRQTPLAAEEMAHIRGVLQFILDRHKPYAAVVLDRYSNCLMGNGASERLVAALVDPSLLAEPMNHLRVLFHPLGVRRWIVNWDEVARTMLGRAERELGQSKDDDASALLSELRDYAGHAPHQRSSNALSVADLLLPIHIRKDDLELRLFSTIMTLGTPQDVTLQELRVETFFPADEASERTWRRVTTDQ
jgi:transcriptional regulator with XRE-family HTH domain